MDPKVKRTTLYRRKQILQKIDDEGEVLINALSKEFEVSEVTIRNDLRQLELKRTLIRARGGAIRMHNNVSLEQGISDKDKINYLEKAAIGKKAAELVKEGDTMIMDSGTTTAEIIKNLSHFEELTIITNALNIVNQLISLPKIKVIIPGGYLRRTSMSLVGPLAEKNFNKFYVDKVFLGVDGFDIHQGIYTPIFEEAHLNEIMIEVAREVILVADSSKFKKRSLAFICPIDVIDTVVTDSGISVEDQRKLEDAGIKVIVA